MWVRRPDKGVDYFLADELKHEHGAWTAVGQWKYHSGRRSTPQRYSWPTSRVVEVRWER